MKTLLIACFFLLSQASAFASGGIVRSGQTLSIGSSGISVSLKPIPGGELPELSLASQSIRQLTLPMELMGRLQKELRPSPQRNFFRVEHLSLEAEKALVEEYRRILPDLPDTDRFTLFSLTRGSDTYLLPAFFALQTPAQKGAVLFHEALQASQIVSSYAEIVNLETLFEATLSCGDQCDQARDDFQFRLTASLDRPVSIQVFLLLLQKAAIADGKSGQLAGIIAPNGDLNYAKFLGPSLAKMMFADFASDEKNKTSTFSIDFREARIQELQEKWPDSKFLRALQNCPFEFHLLRAAGNFPLNGAEWRDYREEYSVLRKWKYEDLNIKFSSQAITYAPEIKDYLELWRSSSHEEEGLEVASNGILPVDSSVPTRHRKVYSAFEYELGGAVPRDDMGVFGEGSSYGTRYLFGFTLN